MEVFKNSPPEKFFRNSQQRNCFGFVGNTVLMEHSGNCLDDKNESHKVFNHKTFAFFRRIIDKTSINYWKKMDDSKMLSIVVHQHYSLANAAASITTANGMLRVTRYKNCLFSDIISVICKAIKQIFIRFATIWFIMLSSRTYTQPNHQIISFRLPK